MNKCRYIRSMYLFAAMLLAAMALSCDNSDPASASSKTATITITDNRSAIFAATLNGNGGTETKSEMWHNETDRATYTVDISSMTGGSVKVVLLDANDNTMLSRLLDASSPEDTISGLTPAGTKGLWTVAITLTNFSGSATVGCLSDK
jgi:hypothetical protein